MTRPRTRFLLSGLLGVPEERFHDLLRSAAKRINTIDRPERCALLPIRLGPHPVLMIIDRRCVGRTTNGHAFAVRRFHENTAFFVLRWYLLAHAKCVRLLGHLAIDAFQAIHVLFQAQDLLHGLRYLAKRLFHREVLIPILQQVRELAFRQRQTGVQGNHLDSLTFPLRVDVPLEVEFSKDRHVGPCMGFFRALEPPAIG